LVCTGGYKGIKADLGRYRQIFGGIWVALWAIGVTGHPSGEIILPQIDNFGSFLDDLLHLEFFTFVRQKRQATWKDITDYKILIDFRYHCGIRKERLRPCLSQRFKVLYNLSLLE